MIINFKFNKRLLCILNKFIQILKQRLSIDMQISFSCIASRKYPLPSIYVIRPYSNPRSNITRPLFLFFYVSFITITDQVVISDFIKLLFFINFHSHYFLF